MEQPSSTLGGVWMTILPTVLAAGIGAVSAVVTILVKDLFIDWQKEKRQHRLSIIDRRLSELYAPLWIVSGTSEDALRRVFADDAAYKGLMKNYHLLSCELQGIISEFMKLGRGDPRYRTLNALEEEQAIKLSRKFVLTLTKEMDELRSTYLRG